MVGDDDPNRFYHPFNYGIFPVVSHCGLIVKSIGGYSITAWCSFVARRGIIARHVVRDRLEMRDLQIRKSGHVDALVAVQAKEVVCAHGEDLAKPHERQD